MTHLDGRPWVGEEREEWQSFHCGYAAAPDAIHCDRDVVWHGIRFETADGDLLAMGSCDEHKPIIDQLCEYIHAHVHPCSIPGSMFRWPENECYLDWDELAEFQAAEVTMAGEA